ncbi:hypothetical protein U1Q18_005395 [Sarracenia purpurea var. burkii]
MEEKRVTVVESRVERAITMYNGIWCLNKNLIVKNAWESNMSLRNMTQKMESISKDGNLDQDYGPNISWEKPRVPIHDMLVVEAKEIDEEWFKAYAVGILNEYTVVESIHDVMVSDGVLGFRIRTLGENKALIIFQDQ